MFWQQSLYDAAILFGASMLAGAVNSVAGGGTLLTFPALLAAGHPALVANATSTVALWPGQVSSLFGYRREIGETRAYMVPLSILGLIGGVVGALLLIFTPKSVFDQIVPFLVLLATVLFMLQEPLSRWQRARLARAAGGRAPGEVPVEPGGVPQFTLGAIPGVLAIAVYGGYFGAGIGILSLALFGLVGFRDIHQMNGVKNVFTLWINGVAAVIFLVKGIVYWQVALLMAVGSIIGGYSGAGIARRIGQKNVRRVVIGVGLVLSLSLLFRAYVPEVARPAATAPAAR